MATTKGKAQGARPPSKVSSPSSGVGLTGPAPQSGSATPPNFLPPGPQARRGSWRPPSNAPSPAGSPAPHSGPRASEPVGPPKLPSNLSSSSIPSVGSSTPSKQQDQQPSDNLLNETVLQLKCSGLTGQKVDVILRQGQKYEGLLGELDRTSGDSLRIVLKMARDVTSPHKGVQREIIFPIRDVTDVRPSGTPEGGASKSTGRDGFQTDTDISRSTPLGQERELTPWQGPSATSSSSKASAAAQGDADTFGAPSNGRGWDQFAENEKRFGTRTNYDEDMYTTKLDRSGKDFKEREKKAEMLAQQIMSATSSNPHLQEERGQAVDSSLGEEDRYSGVARSTNAYVPPGARRPGASPQPSPTPPSVLHQSMAAKGPATPLNGVASGSTTPTPLAHPAPAIVAATAGMARSSSSAGHVPAAKAEVPRSAAEDLGAARQQVVPVVRVPSTASTAAEEVPAGGEKSALSAFHEFVKSDRQRLEQKKKQMEGKAKSEKDKRLKELVRFGQDFKLKTTIPDDLVPILAKDAEKQKEIVAKATADALIASTRTSPVLAKSTVAAPSAANASAFANRRQAPPSAVLSPNSVAARAAGKIPMAIQDIPPFNPAAKSAKNAGAVPAGPPSPAFSTASQANAKLNINAPAFVFKPNPNASAFRPSLPPAAAPKPPPVREIPPHHSQVNPRSPQPLAAQQAPPQPSPQPVVSTLPPNPFFGTKPFKRSAAVNVRDDFNPHKLTKVGESTAYLPNWPYSGKPYRFLFPQDPVSLLPSGDSLGFNGGYHPDGMPPSAISLAAGMAPPHAVSPNLHHAQIHPGMYPQQHGGHMGQQQHYPPYGQFPGAPYRHMSHLGQPGGQYANGGGPGPMPAGAMPFNSPGGRNESGGGPGPQGGYMPPWAAGTQMGHPGGMPPNMYGTPHPGAPYANQPGGSYSNGAPGPPPPRGGYYQGGGGGGSQMQSPQMGHVYPNQQQQQRPPFDTMGGAGVGSPHGPPQAHFAGANAAGAGGGPAGGPEGTH